MTESGQSGPIEYLSVCIMVIPLVRPFLNSYSPPDLYGRGYVVGSRFYCLSVCKATMSAYPEFSGSLSGSVGLGVMPPVLALASDPLVREVLDGGMPSSTALTPAAFAPLETPQVSEVESSTLPSVMPSQPELGLSL